MITTKQMAKLLDWLHAFDVPTIRQVITTAETVIASKEKGNGIRPEEDGEEFTDETPMPFGKYEGTPLGKIKENYLRWLWEQRPVKGSARLEKWLAKHFDEE